MSEHLNHNFFAKLRSITLYLQRKFSIKKRAIVHSKCTTKGTWLRFWSNNSFSDFNVFNASLRHFYRQPNFEYHLLSNKRVK